MTPLETALVLAVLAQVLFTFAVMVRAGRARFRAAREKRIKGDIALSHAGWPDDVLKLGNNMNNQFETPTLFYALSILALVLKLASLPLVVLAWAYFVLRVLHSLEHTGPNRVLRRFRIFLAGLACLGGMALVLTGQVLVAAL